jgi:hypothetical protein
VLRWTKSSKSWPSASYNERILVGVLAQCTALAHLNLKDNRIGEAGVESLAGALGHLHLGHNFIGTVGRKRLRASWRGPASGLFFDPFIDGIRLLV